MIIALERLCGVVATYVGYAPPPKLQEVRLTTGPHAFCLLRVEGVDSLCPSFETKRPISEASALRAWAEGFARDLGQADRVRAKLTLYLS